MMIAVHQPQYLSWPGLFDKMDRVDRFVFLDVVQYVPREWQNRNRIRTFQGTQWLSVPVHARGRLPIDRVTIDNASGWSERHLRTLHANYRRCRHYHEVMGWFEPLVRKPWERLADLNIEVTLAMARALGVVTPTVKASELGPLPEEADDRILAICERCGASEYLAGAGGHGYMDLDRYRRRGVRVRFQEFTAPTYPQVHGAPIAGLSALDLLFQAGPGAFRQRKEAA